SRVATNDSLPDATRHAVVEQHTLHACAGSATERRAYSRTATACSRVTPSNSSRNSSRLNPASRFSNSASTGTRVPAKQTRPPRRSGSLHTGKSLFIAAKYHCRKVGATTLFTACFAFSAFSQVGLNIGTLLPGEKIEE